MITQSDKEKAAFLNAEHHPERPTPVSIACKELDGPQMRQVNGWIVAPGLAVTRYNNIYSLTHMATGYALPRCDRHDFDTAIAIGKKVGALGDWTQATSTRLRKVGITRATVDRVIGDHGLWRSDEEAT